MLRLADLLAVRINQVDSPGSCQAAAVNCCRAVAGGLPGLVTAESQNQYLS